MKTFDKIFFGIIFGSIFPVIFFLAGWWSTVGLVRENRIFIFAFSGFIIGILLDFFILKKIIENLFRLNIFLLVITYSFYSICLFGFFMGVPVFNVLLGIPAGYYIAKKCRNNNKSEHDSKRQIKRIALFTTYIIIIIAFLSAFIALSDPYTVNNLNGMLGLQNIITQSILYIIVIAGGLVLVFAQYAITRFSAELVYSRIKN